MRKSGFVAAVLCLFPVMAAAQGTKISGKVSCGPPMNEQTLAVEGRPDHSYRLSQTKCTWTQPWEFAGVASKEGTGTGTAEIHGQMSRNSGTYVDTMANGDKAYYSYEFQMATKDGKTQITGHKWTLLGGTGKMRGVKGKGSCTVTAKEDGSADYDCQGEYQPAG